MWHPCTHSHTKPLPLLCTFAPAAPSLYRNRRQTLPPHLPSIQTHVQVAQRELALTHVHLTKRYANGSEASLDSQLQAETSYGEALGELGREWKDAGILALAAEAYMNLFPWDYYKARICLCVRV